jgi:hypothetical protein
MKHSGRAEGQHSSAQASHASLHGLCCVALVLVVLAATSSRVAAQLDTEACYIGDAELGPAPAAAGDSVCNSTCRAETFAALQGIYEQMGGPTWNFNIEDDTGADRQQRGWMECPAGGCRPASV